MTRRYWDITLPLSPTLPAWPGEPKPVIEKISTLGVDGDANVSRLDTCVHFGTHLDAPIHFIEGDASVESLTPDVLIGETYVADMRGQTIIDDTALSAADIPRDCRRLLIRSDNSELWNTPDHPFYPDYVAISPAGARWLVDHNIVLVGIDYLSVEPYAAEGFETHLTLLGAHVVAVEGLDLRDVPSGTYEMACLPIKIVGSDGAPARVILWRDE